MLIKFLVLFFLLTGFISVKRNSQGLIQPTEQWRQEWLNWNLVVCCTGSIPSLCPLVVDLAASIKRRFLLWILGQPVLSSCTVELGQKVGLSLAPNLPNFYTFYFGTNFDIIYTQYLGTISGIHSIEALLWWPRKQVNICIYALNIIQHFAARS